MAKDLRSFLDKLQKVAPKELARIEHQVDPKFELSGIIAKLEQESKYPTVLFEKVKGTRFPVICNLLANRKKMAVALDTTEEKLNEEFRLREEKPLPLKTVKDGPVREVILTGKNINLLQFPQIVHNEKDGGAYISPGVMIVKDPDTGVYNDGCYRHMIKNKNTLGIHLSETSHAYRIYSKYEKRNEPMDAAIVLGHHPAFLLGSLSFVPYGTNELEVDGGVMGENLEVVKCETVDLVVPAHAEIVIEGRILPKVRKSEGPFGEYTGVYGPQRVNPEVEVTAITMRKDAIFYDLYPSGAEHLLWGGTPRLSQIYKRIKMVVPGVKEVYMPISGCCRFICYISMEKIMDTEPREAIMAAFTADPFIKYCVAVDTDVNIFDDAKVLYAISTRLQPDNDVFVIRGCRGSILDPTGTEGYTREGLVRYVVTKVGIDATKPLSGYPESVSVPGGEKIKLKDHLG
jgi:2,5-furandicarboxylate decarboxylase 1